MNQESRSTKIFISDVERVSAQGGPSRGEKRILGALQDLLRIFVSETKQKVQ